ncbi:hypothetical protein IWQ47_004875 [Aquimarina sp. EL_43]|uniref:hypothetical protein n=1 Tax=Aquimarina TaxID=290174 RepID=UPI000472C5A9|nr:MULTISPECIES: hypothetical protein [Aquimarina]MBG6133465.1 hypothetical protein [Aquimarina sp. EL_35]MBG6153623.1 hypothetical protein [Aquimarina sp. EL_32]MBG6171779.1 hypothetical protein [Aquimarina sp. EL_43]
MSEELFDILGNISSFIVIVPLILSGYKFKSLNIVQKKLLYLLIIVLIVESISNILWYKKINNLPVYHFFTVIHFLLIVNIYRRALSQTFSKYFFTSLSIGFVVFAIVNIVFFQDLLTFNSNATTLMGAIIIFLSLSYFYALLKEVKYSTLETNPMFWINSGFLIYFSSSLILFFMNNTLFKGVTEASHILWGLHAVINIVLTIFYTVAIWVKPQKEINENNDFLIE